MKFLLNRKVAFLATLIKVFHWSKSVELYNRIW